MKNENETPKANQEPAASRKLENQPESTDKSRNVVSSQPIDDEELADNMAAADSSLEKPVDQEK